MRVRNSCGMWGLFALVVMSNADAEPRLAFTTADLGNGNLSSWPAAQAVQVTGLDAADAICRQAAFDAGLPESAQFVAWLSDTQTDAYCRVLGLGGHRATNCGGQLGSTAAGPWVRTDGLPFAASLDALVDGQVLSPLLRDEFGETLNFPYEVFSATSPSGEYVVSQDSEDCLGWTSSSAQDGVALGTSTGTTGSWSDSSAGTSCDVDRRLICLQRGQGDPLPPRPVAGKALAFVSEALVSGNLGGIEGADALCVQDATDAGLADASTFKALLTSAASGDTAASRLESDRPWFRVDGMPLVDSKSQLAMGRVDVPLNVSAQGDYLGHSHAYTGALANGMPSVNDCNGWTSVFGVASASTVNEVFFNQTLGTNWLGTSTVSCAPGAEPSRHLYCFSDVEPVFADGFEP